MLGRTNPGPGTPPEKAPYSCYTRWLAAVSSKCSDTRSAPLLPGKGAWVGGLPMWVVRPVVNQQLDFQLR